MNKLLIAILTFACATVASAQTSSTMKKYTKVPAGYLMVLRQGDPLFENLEQLATAEKIPTANISGMGFVNITFGFFDNQTKKYNPKSFNNVELASMLGTIAWKEGKPSVHAHGVVGDETFQTFGGHILSATVGTGSLEILITVHDKKLERKKDEALGADVLEVK